jgi:hypothetical protein
MLFHFIAVLALGVVAALAVYVLRSWIGGRLPGYAYPIAVGAAMLTYNIWAEYTWYQRTKAQLPARIEAFESYETKSAFQPWTYLAPRINRFVAVDTASKKRNEKAPGQVLASVLLIKRFEPTIQISYLFDCPGRRMAEIGTDVRFDADTGLPENVKWTSEGTMMEALDVVCVGEETAADPAEPSQPATSAPANSDPAPEAPGQAATDATAEPGTSGESGAKTVPDESLSPAR